MADVKTLFAVILAFLFAFEVNTLGLVFKGSCPNGIGRYLEIIKCNGTSCSAGISGRSCNPSKTSFNIINAPATGGTTRKCIQFTSNSVIYALKVIGTNPPTLQFMKQPLCDQTTKVDKAYLFEEQPISSGSVYMAYIYTHNNTRMCLSRVCKDTALTLKTIKVGPQGELDRMCSFRRKKC
ncbi:hypothetical protein ABFA07_003905 [Porites harrisoni]